MPFPLVKSSHGNITFFWYCPPLNSTVDIRRCLCREGEEVQAKEHMRWSYQSHMIPEGNGLTMAGPDQEGTETRGSTKWLNRRHAIDYRA